MLTAEDILNDDAYSLLGIEKIISKLRKNGEDFDEKDLRHYYKQQEVNQRTSPQKKPTKRLKITGPPGAYQVDLIFLPKFRSSNRGITTFLLLVEILSRKAFAYPVTFKKPSDLLDAYEQFIMDQDGNVIDVYADDEFSKRWFRAYNDVLNVNIHTGIAKDDHVSKYSNRLGIVDRLVRTLRKLMNKYMLVKNTTKWSKWLPEIIRLYNNTPHASLNDRTPNEVNSDLNGMEKIFKQDVEYNQGQDDKANPIAVDDVVRILTPKGTFAKEGPRFSEKLYDVVKKEGFKWRVRPHSEDSSLPKQALIRQKLADNDLLVVDQKSLVPLPTRPSKAVRDEKTERHRTRLQREGIISNKRDLDLAVLNKRSVPTKPIDRSPIKVKLCSPGGSPVTTIISYFPQNSCGSYIGPNTF